MCLIYTITTVCTNGSKMVAGLLEDMVYNGCGLLEDMDYNRGGLLEDMDYIREVDY